MIGFQYFVFVVLALRAVAKPLLGDYDYTLLVDDGDQLSSANTEAPFEVAGVYSQGESQGNRDDATYLGTTIDGQSGRDDNWDWNPDLENLDVIVEEPKTSVTPKSKPKPKPKPKPAVAKPFICPNQGSTDYSEHCCDPKIVLSMEKITFCYSMKLEAYNCGPVENRWCCSYSDTLKKSPNSLGWAGEGCSRLNDIKVWGFIFAYDDRRRTFNVGFAAKWLWNTGVVSCKRFEWLSTTSGFLRG